MILRILLVSFAKSLLGTVRAQGPLTARPPLLGCYRVFIKKIFVIVSTKKINKISIFSVFFQQKGLGKNPKSLGGVKSSARFLMNSNEMEMRLHSLSQ